MREAEPKIWVCVRSACQKYWFERYRPEPQGGTNFSGGTNNALQSVLVMIFITTISDVFAHASYKCPVNNCFQ